MLIHGKSDASSNTDQSDVTADIDQEIFYPYLSVTEKIYDTADIGLAPEDTYIKLMGHCMTKESVCN